MKERPVENVDFLGFRVTILVAVAAVGLTIKFLTGRDMSALMINYEAWPEEPWRLLTACLLHGSWLHLAFNVYWTFRFGAIVEPIFGIAATLGIYILFGATSMGAEWAFLGKPIGLSGVVYGLFGLLWALDRYHPNYAGVMNQGTTQLFVVWFFFCIVATYTGMLSIANIAHGVGAVVGGLLGLSFAFREDRRRIGRFTLPVLVITIAMLSTIGRPYVNLSPYRAFELFDDSLEALKAGDYEGAAAILEEAVSRNPEFGTAWHNLGVAYQRLGRPIDAARAFSRADELGYEPE